jgi:hypothetical protein
MKRAVYTIDEVLDWKMGKNETLRQSIVDQAEDDLAVGEAEGTIKVTVEGSAIVATFEEATIVEEQK